MGRRPAPAIDGLCVVDKEPGWTSHDVVAKARGILGTRKVGHSGTLDPDATGVLLLGVGRATRLLRFLTALGKSYEGEVVLGVETTTLDAAGEVVARHDMAGVDLEQVRRAAAAFVGRIEQVPPMVSAIKVDGRRLHALAREGVEVERAARPVTVHRFEVAPTDEPHVFRIDVDCSSGTYVRSLAADLGRSLGGGAHLRNLRRTAVGSFTLAEARPLGQLELLALEVTMRDYPALLLDEEHAVAVGHGKRLPAALVPDRVAPAGTMTGGADAAVASDVADVTPGGDGGSGGDAMTPAGHGGPWAVCGPDGSLLAVYERRDGNWLVPAVVLAR
jgi:tRNA pseudouridine55 synthase